MSYPQEKFYQAMLCLVSDGPLRQRLAGAAMYLRRLGWPEDFHGDEEAKRRWEQIIHDLTHVEAGPGDDGNIDATTKRLTDDEAKRIAGEILSVYHDLCGGWQIHSAADQRR